LNKKDASGNYLISDEEAERKFQTSLEKILSTHKISDEEEKFLDVLTDQVLGTPAAKKRKFGSQEEDFSNMTEEELRAIIGGE